MSHTITRADWRRCEPMRAGRPIPPPGRTFTPKEFKLIAAGFRPRAMEQKWFVFCEVPWLYLHRSWTGACAYQARFALRQGRFVVEELLASEEFNPDWATTEFAGRVLDNLCRRAGHFSPPPGAG
jgi:hypothetical protein